MWNSIEFTVGEFIFQSIDAFINRSRIALYSVPLGAALIGEDAELAQAVFYARLDKVAQLNGRTVLHYIRGKHRYNKPCFFAVLSDGGKLHFSFMKLTKPNKI